MSVSQISLLILLHFFLGSFRLFARFSSFKTLAKITTALFHSSHSAPSSLSPSLSPSSSYFTPSEQQLLRIRATRQSWQDDCAARPFLCPSCSSLCRTQWRNRVCCHRHSSLRRYPWQDFPSLPATQSQPTSWYSKRPGRYPPKTVPEQCETIH